MNKYVFLVLIILYAFLARFYALGDNPASLDWDEASLGYNAYSILKTGRDEYGTFLPTSIRSFGDFKPPLYTYLTVPAVSVFGLNEFATRVPSAFFGTLTVLVCYFLVRGLFPDRSQKLALLSTFFLAVSPWHIQFSRIAFESNVGVFFFMLAVAFFLRGTRSKTALFFSVISLVLSMYSYHSPRLVGPIFFLGAFFLNFKLFWKQKAWVLLAGIIGVLLLFPIIRDMYSSTARLNSVTILNPTERLGRSIMAMEEDRASGDIPGNYMHNRRLVYGREILGGYLDHFNFDFLFLKGDPPGRHHAAAMGMLYIWDLPFIIAGVLVLLSIIRNNQDEKKNALLLAWWFLVAPVASSLTSGTPHAVRALLYLPTYQIFIALGVYWLTQNGYMAKWLYGFFPTIKPSNHSTIATIFMSSVLCSLFIVNSYYYMVMYYIHTPVEYASEWQYGYREAVAIARQHEDQYDRIIVTYRYDQPYVFFLFYNQIDPVWYQAQWRGGEIERFNRNFGKYEFRNIDWEKDSQLNNVLLVGTPKEIPDEATGKIADIPFPDGTVSFRIVGR